MRCFAVFRLLSIIFIFIFASYVPDIFDLSFLNPNLQKVNVGSVVEKWDKVPRKVKEDLKAKSSQLFSRKVGFIHLGLWRNKNKSNIFESVFQIPFDNGKIKTFEVEVLHDLMKDNVDCGEGESLGGFFFGSVPYKCEKYGEEINGTYKVVFTKTAAGPLISTWIKEGNGATTKNEQILLMMRHFEKWIGEIITGFIKKMKKKEL